MQAIKDSTPITADALRAVRTLLSRLMIQKWWRIPRDYDEATTPNNLCKGLSLTFDDLYTMLRSIGLLHLQHHMGAGEPQQSSAKSNLSPSSSIGVNEAMLYRLPLLLPSLNLQVLTGFPTGSRRFVYYILRGTPTTTTTDEQPPAMSTRAFLGNWFVLPKADNEITAASRSLAGSNKAVSVMELSTRNTPLQDIEASVNRASSQEQRCSSTTSNSSNRRGAVPDIETSKSIPKGFSPSYEEARMNRVSSFRLGIFKAVPDIETSKSSIRKDRLLPVYEGAIMNRALPSRLGIFNAAVLDIPRSTRRKRKNAPTQEDEAAPVKRASPNHPSTTAATSSNQTVPPGLMATSQYKDPFVLL